VHVDGICAGNAVLSDPVGRYQRRFRKGEQTKEDKNTGNHSELIFSMSGKVSESSANEETPKAVAVEVYA